MAGGMCGGGACVGQGVCVVGGMHSRGHGGMWQGRHAWQGGMCGRGACVAEEMVTAEDGTHPTGMRSCFYYLCWQQLYNNGIYICVPKKPAYLFIQVLRGDSHAHSSCACMCVYGVHVMQHSVCATCRFQAFAVNICTEYINCRHGASGLPIICEMSKSQTAVLWMRFIKINLTL